MTGTRRDTDAYQDQQTGCHLHVVFRRCAVVERLCVYLLAAMFHPIRKLPRQRNPAGVQMPADLPDLLEPVQSWNRRLNHACGRSALTLRSQVSDRDPRHQSAAVSASANRSTAITSIPL